MRLDNEMQYVYVLTSCEKDFYYEQFLLSLTSLRLYNPDVKVIALIDEKTKQGLTGKRLAYEKLLSEIKTIKVPGEYSQKEASRWIKTSINRFVSGGFLFIDCDTVITKKLDFNFPAEIKIGAVLDTHITLENHHLREFFRKEDAKAGFSSSLKTNRRYNGGIIFCGDAPNARDFFEKWHSLWLEGLKKGCSQDMPSLNQANYELGNVITELGGEWNCQISHNGLPYLSNAKIIHYYATAFHFINSPFIPASKKVLESIKETGTISGEITELLKNPGSAFEQNSRIIAGEAELDVVNSKFFSLLLRIRKKRPKLFKSLNSFVIKKIIH